VSDEEPKQFPNRYRTALEAVASQAQSELTTLGYGQIPGPAEKLSSPVNDRDKWNSPLCDSYAQSISSHITTILSQIEAARSQIQAVCDGPNEPSSFSEETAENSWKIHWNIT
jgi:hypothetical protein